MVKPEEIIGTAGPWKAGSKPPYFELPDEQVNRRIRERAFQIWESNGRPAGKDHLYWSIAEEEILGH